MLVFWATIAALVAWERSRPVREWIGQPHGGAGWSAAAVVMGLASVREFISGWRVLEFPHVLILWLAFGLVNPWFEEAYWRGLLIDASRGWRGLGVVYSAIAFALSHPLIWGVNCAALRHPSAVTALGLVGIVWGLTYWRTGSLRWTIVGHGCANLLGLSVPVMLNVHVPAGLR
jgi:membrane protease YdiL (CAAX protease family)